MFPLVYRSISALVNRLPLQQGKLATSLAGRRAAVTRWIEWASTNRTNRPLIWVHGASVGENLSATPVVARLRAALPGLQVLHSHTSPSVTSWHIGFGGDQTDYLPPDDPESIRKVLRSVKPDIILFSRGDLWPAMVQTATACRVPVAVIGGTVSPSSRRLWPVVRRALMPTYRSVSWLGAVSRGDANRWIALGAPAHVTAVTGDPRHDQVLERRTDLSEISPFRTWCSGSTVLVAGSTDERDERALLEAYSGIVRSDSCRTRLMIVPHEVSKSRVDHVRDLAEHFGIAAEVWDGGSPKGQSQCIVVKKMGVLADLYALAQIAYVGGGFRRGGLHAVIEPAAFALPVIAGHNHAGSRDFDVLLKGDGAVALPRHGAVAELQRTWVKLAQNALIRTETGLRARKTLHQGAASASAQALLRLMSKPNN